MGLLNFDAAFNSDEGRLGLGLLAAGSARADGAGFGQRLMEAVNSVDQWKQAQEAKKLRDLQIQHYQMQMQQLLEQQKAQQRKQDALPSLWTEASPGAPALRMDDYLPVEARTGMMPQPAIAPTRGGIDVRKGIMAGYTPEELKSLDSLRNLGRDKIAQWKEVEGPNGQKLQQGFDEYGNPVGKPVAGYVDPVQVNQGDRVAFVKPSAGVSLPVNMSPMQRDESARGWANYGLAKTKEAREASNANGPQFHDGMWIVKPNAQLPQGGAFNVPGYSKPVTESQAKAQLFGSRMAEANRIMADLAAKGTDQPGLIKRGAESIPWVGGGLGSMANVTQSDNQQMVEQAQRDFVNAVLRRESGAAISPSEFDNAKKQYFPQIGDSPAVKAQKQKNRELAIAGMLAEVPGGGSLARKPDAGDPLGLFNNDPLGLRGGR